MNTNAVASKDGLDAVAWTLVLERIKQKRCTPIIGSGVCVGGPPLGVSEEKWTFKYPIGADLAREWATECEYPFEDSSRIERVAQFLGVKYDQIEAKLRIAECLTKASLPDFEVENEPHRVLAELGLPVYITSNFDDYLLRALRRMEKDVRVSLCRWNKHIPRDAPAYDPDPAQHGQVLYCRVSEGQELGPLIYTPETDAEFTPSPSNPVVYYFLGHLNWPESLVVSEDDYFEFLLNLSKAQRPIMPRVEQALGSCSLLFLGYKLADWDFSVLFRILGVLGDWLKETPTHEHKHIAVQLEPTDIAGDAEKALRYLVDYYGARNIIVSWGACQQFVAELKRRRG